MERKYYEINEESAKRAHEMMSYRDYRMGSKTEEYRSYVDKAYNLADKIAAARPNEADRVYKLAERYSRKMAENMNASSRIGCMCPSVLVTGASNFPVHKKEKQNAADDRNRQDFFQIQQILSKMESILYRKDMIKSDDERAIEKLEEKLESLKDSQEMMRAANKAIRMKDTVKGDEMLRDMGFSAAQIQNLRTPDFCGRVGYPNYALANNNTNIHRVEKRLNELKAVKEKGTQETETEFFKVVRNTEEMRLQLIFDGKPDPEIREILKKNGFRWAPSNQAWQRHLNGNSEYALKQVMEGVGHLALQVQ